MTHLRRGDADLHHKDGSHRTTSPSTAGHMITNHERRITAHLASHREAAMQDGPWTVDYKHSAILMTDTLVFEVHKLPAADGRSPGFYLFGEGFGAAGVHLMEHMDAGLARAEALRRIKRRHPDLIIEG